MDKELLRIVIIATGLMIIMGMLAWSYLKNKKSQEDLDFYDKQEFTKPADTSLNIENDVEHEINSEDLDAAEHHNDQDDATYETEEDDTQPTPRVTAPDIIQFCLVAKSDKGFNGTDLFNAFGIVGLEYGNLKIFERLDVNRLVDFGVACMVEPGTFPDSNLDTFYCPGLVFFMQPAALDNPQAVFDDYVETIQLLAIELDGVIRDNSRQTLTDATIQSLRQSL